MANRSQRGPASGILSACLAGTLVLYGCASGPSGRPAPSGTPAQSGALQEVSVALEETLPRSAPFGPVEFTVVAAEVTNVPPLSFGAEPTPGPNLIAHLTVSARNGGSSDPTYGFRNDAFWLRTYSGQVIGAADNTGLHVNLRPPPGESEQGELYYFVPRQDALIGAVLLIGRPPDALAFLPLTGNQVEPAYPVELAAIGSSSAHVGPIRWEVTSARLSQDLPAGVCCPETGQRADETELFLTLSLRGTVEGSQYGHASLTSNEVELLVDGASVGEAFGFSGQANISEGDSYDFDATWLVPAELSELAVSFSSLDGDTGRVVLEVPAE